MIYSYLKKYLQKCGEVISKERIDEKKIQDRAKTRNNEIRTSEI